MKLAMTALSAATALALLASEARAEGPEMKESPSGFAAKEACANAAGAGADLSGAEDSTGALNAAMAKGSKSLFFPRGSYRIAGKLEIPGETSLLFESGATLALEKGGGLVLKGDGIAIDGACFDLSALSGEKAERAAIEGSGVRRFKAARLRTVDYGAQDAKEAVRKKLSLIKLEKSRDVEVSECMVANIGDLLSASFCARVAVHGNRAENCHRISAFNHGCEWLQHYGNWSRDVTYQCMWWGGDSDDSHKWVSKNSARDCVRGSGPDDPGYDKDRAGAYDILVENNIAERGTTLAWGSKGRNVVISGNLARFMDDLAYDTEGGENVVISGNISINSKSHGIGCYFYGERLLISGNQILTLKDGDERRQGGFVRVHSPGDSSHFGNGEVLISGNQFICETGKPRGVDVEAARRVVVKGNSFKNGRVSCITQCDDIEVSECSFLFDCQGEGQSAIVLRGGKERLVKGNVVRFKGEEPSREPAIRIEAEKGTRVALDANVIDNWATPFSLNASKGPAKLALFGNRYDGKPSLSGEWSKAEGMNMAYGAANEAAGN